MPNPNNQNHQNIMIKEIATCWATKQKAYFNISIQDKPKYFNKIQYRAIFW